ncbi:MATE family efflux transporter [Butyrivibrio proteoclasticus]|uniref:MATE family efflux transporter n=1 Tax=Butyrivibrio proteoclasticus TaxID=43305 RepID=UPI000478E953|nr:MATE family efflux transporter [Butyrivibrio proteoclasticus]
MNKENKMGYMPIKKLIISMSLPMMVSMLVQALYNIVDSIFVSNIATAGGDNFALKAVTLAFPMQNFMIAMGSGTGVGINSLLSRSLGEKNYGKANDAANAGIFLTLVNYIIFLFIGIFGAHAFIASQTKDQAAIEMGTTYLSIICIMSIGLFFQVTFERLLQSTGKTVYSMISQATGAIINIIFDPLLIFGYGPFPELGVAGAAYATILGQCCAALIGLFCNLKFNHEISFDFKGIFKLKGNVIKEIYYVGLPSILMMSIGSLMTYLMDKILDHFNNATSVFGIYFKLQSFIFMPVFGLNNGLIPVLAFNYGAKNKERIKEALKFAFVLALSIMISGTLIFQLFPASLLKLFNDTGNLKEIGIPALRTISLSFPLAGICIVMGSIFQAFAKSFYSLIISVGRQLVVLIPTAWLLSMTGNVNNIWWSFLFAELASLCLSSFFFKRLYKTTVSTL